MRISDWSSDVCSSDLGELVRLVLLDFSNLTGGANGIAGIAPVEILGFSFDSRGRMYGLALVVALASTLFMRRLFLRPIGRAIDSVADNPALAESTGLGVHRLQVFAFVLGCGLDRKSVGSGKSVYGVYISLVAVY